MRPQLLMAAALLAVGTASAAPPPDQPAGPTDPNGNSQRTIPTDPGQERSDQSLSDKLDQSHGVLRPAPMPDKGVHKPAVPPANDRDVIVPPTEQTPRVNPK